MPICNGQADRGALNVGYDDAGPPDGLAVVLLHGSYDIHSYGGVTPQLAAAGYRVIVPYLRGYGMTSFLSSRAPRSGDQAVFAVDAIALLDALKIPKAVVGGSCLPLRSAATSMALRKTARPIEVNLPDHMSIGSSTASATMCPRKRRRRLPMRFNM